MLDEDDYDNLSEGDRQAAEAAMRRRDREEGRGEGGRMGKEGDGFVRSLPSFVASICTTVHAVLYCLTDCL